MNNKREKDVHMLDEKNNNLKNARLQQLARANKTRVINDPIK